jgi:hypothetical protein
MRLEKTSMQGQVRGGRCGGQIRREVSPVIEGEERSAVYSKIKCKQFGFHDFITYESTINQRSSNG